MNPVLLPKVLGLYWWRCFGSHPIHPERTPDSPKLNHTYVALIPKKPKPELISDFCPTSLYNVAYKLITKVIANRLKPSLLSIISDTQGAFTQGRLISDNILVAYEVLHAMRSGTNLDDSMVVKFDMSKLTAECFEATTSVLVPQLSHIFHLQTTLSSL